VTRPYTLTKGAAADIREITRYSLEKWGNSQCRAYIRQIEKAAEEVAIGKGVFKDMSALLPGLRMKIIGRHYLFCLPQTTGPTLILAILHDRMDIIVRLKDRLT
jgi:toxin ParE1/3/4